MQTLNPKPIAPPQHIPYCPTPRAITSTYPLPPASPSLPNPLLATPLLPNTHMNVTPPPPPPQDMTVKAEVPAIAMEEAAPVAVSKAALQLPGEVYAAKAKDGRPVAEAELSRCVCGAGGGEAG